MGAAVTSPPSLHFALCIPYTRPGRRSQAQRWYICMWKPIAALCAGGSLGTLLRWWLGTQLNGLFPSLPPGTLIANWIGAYIVGLALALLGTLAALAPEWRLFVVTGFCGGLTTFSTFSAEVVQLLQQSRPTLAFTAVALHLLGSLAMTFAGIATALWLRGV